MSKVGIVILAAGDGKRMKTGIPKVMNLLHGKPLIGHVVDHVLESGLVEKPVVVVSAGHNLVQEYLGDRAVYVIQDKQLGTGHAVACAETELKNKCDSLVILYGDMPFITASSLKKLVESHISNKNILTMLTITVPDFEGWRKYFYDFSRIIRDKNGEIIEDVQMKDATKEELTITELNPCYFCFDSKWLWSHLKQLKTDNTQAEYYLTDLVKFVMVEGAKLGTVQIDPTEAIGINTKEHLEIAENIK